MEEIIIYKDLNSQKFCVLFPSYQLLNIVSIHDIARKDVPKNYPYWIVNSSELPSFEYLHAIYIDENENPPHGYGSESNEFPLEILEKIRGF